MNMHFEQNVLVQRLDHQKMTAFDPKCPQPTSRIQHAPKCALDENVLLNDLMHKIYNRMHSNSLHGISMLGWMAPEVLMVGGECRPSTMSDSASWASPWITAMPRRRRSANDWALRKGESARISIQASEIRT